MNDYLNGLSIGHDLTHILTVILFKHVFKFILVSEGRGNKTNETAPVSIAKNRDDFFCFICYMSNMISEINSNLT